MVKIIIMVDDVNQEEGYRPNQNMLDLIEDYDVKFSLFIPAKFKGKPLTKEFISTIGVNPNIDIYAHGLEHDRENDAEEFKDLTEDEIEQKIFDMDKIWNNVMGYNPSVYKSPGWCTPLYVYKHLKDAGYKLVCDHMINTGLKDFNGIYRIGYDYSIDNLPKELPKDKDIIILQSHISEIGGSKNTWNEMNTLKFRLWLDDLKKKMDIEFIFIEDVL